MHKTREAIDEQQKAEFILEGNKLIGEFMGDFKLVEEFKPEPDIDVTYMWKKISNKGFGYDTTDWRDYSTDTDYSDQVCYNFKWDWLMPVVEKIEEVDVVASFQIEQPTIYIWASSENSTFEDIKIEIFNKTKIEAVYQAVVEFIKWYNKNAANS